ncbi:MAG: alpha/beta hydrolase [Gammaproteobacteria bacterium]|jgi:pimeloyl-ACP methyl ester carboxylesterase
MKATRILGIGALLLVLGIVGYAAKYMYERQKRLSPADPAALTALLSSDAVTVTVNGWYTFEPVGTSASKGFIFYPGGECDERGYAELMHAIAAKGYLVVLVPMPLQLAVLAPDKAEDVMEAFPDIQSWAIGGHSLGGAMAARFVYKHPGRIDGLLFWDAYPPKTDDISERNLAVTLIHRSGDDGEPPDYYAEYKHLLPAAMEYRPLPGAVHINFGRFIPAARFQTELPPKLDIDSQHQLIIRYTTEFLAGL